jgi:hypothetical protein
MGFPFEEAKEGYREVNRKIEREERINVLRGRNAVYVFDCGFLPILNAL